MPHERKRFILDNLKHLLRYSPAVALFGHRQVGKTTLLSQFSNALYFTLDDAAALEFARSSPKSFIEHSQNKLMIIDECQLAPELFPAIKEYIRKHPKPGSFILAGSVRFTSRKQIRESLTGRILIQELLPFSIEEAQGNLKDPLKYLESGGLPRPLFTRNLELRSQLFNSYLDNVLGRDLQLVLQTSLSVTTTRRVLAELAKSQGSPLNYAFIARATRVSVPTVRKLVGAFEALFLIRLIPILGGYGKHTVLFEDAGEASHLMSQSPSNILQDLLRVTWSNLRVSAQVHYPGTHEFYQYRTRGGAEVDLVLKTKKSHFAFIFIPDEDPTPKSLGSAKAFIQKYPDAKVFLVHPKTKTQSFSKSVQLIGVSSAIEIL
jgi:predicted AAA+ superfamily ATPase